MPPTRQPSPAATPPQLDDAATESIRLKAHRVVRGAGLPRSDVPDAAQDIALHVCARLGRYRPGRAVGRDPFVRMLVAHATATVLDNRLRARRPAPIPLARLFSESGGPDGDPPDPRFARREDQAALALDVAAILSRLPPRLRRVAEALKTDSVTVAARRLGLTRAEVYRRLGALRRAFVAAGLGAGT